MVIFRVLYFGDENSREFYGYNFKVTCIGMHPDKIKVSKTTVKSAHNS